jgi:16S rRNA processing protein RimM
VTEAPQTLPFGRLGRPHGVRGEIVLRPFNPDGDVLARTALPAVVQLVREKERREMTLVAVRPANDTFLVCLEGVETRDQAAALTNFELWLSRSVLPALASDEFYVEDLVGCVVVDLAGKERGTIKSTFWNGAQDVLALQGPEGELLVPAVAEFLRSVDLEARRVIVDMHE